MAVTARDWKFLDDVLTSLRTKVQDATHIPLPGDPTLAPISQDAAKTYLADVAKRFAHLENKALELARGAAEDSPPYQLGKEIGRTLVVGAKRAAKIAKEVGSDLAENFEKTADRLEEGGLTIAKGFGTGLALAVIFGLIWALRKS
jgi:hypothetical protein